LDGDVEMRHTRNRYQHGSIRKVPRANGFAWEFRFYCSDENGERKLKTQTFDAIKYPTVAAVRKAVESQLGALNSDTMAGKVSATMNTIINRYYAEEFPSLRHSTQSTNRSLIDLHIRPKFGDVRPSDVSAILVKNWLEKCSFGAAQKARARNIISKLLDLSMLWEYIPLQRNPMQLVKIKGSTKRQKKLVILTPDQFKTYTQSLPEPYSLMVLVSGCFGFRVSETLALKWADFDFGEGTVQVRRVFTHSRIQELPKTDASADPLPVHLKLMAVLQQWREKQANNDSWVFPSPRTGGPYSDSTILTDHLKPAAVRMGIKGLGWHTFRHSYKSWLATAKVEPSRIKDLMRHADISTTMNVYGKTVSKEMRNGNALVVKKLL
jgi:integrase